MVLGIMEMEKALCKKEPPVEVDRALISRWSRVFFFQDGIVGQVPTFPTSNNFASTTRSPVKLRRLVLYEEDLLLRERVCTLCPIQTAKVAIDQSSMSQSPNRFR